jgi:uncharacterized protein YjiS (DUF1127 family)
MSRIDPSRIPAHLSAFDMELAARHYRAARIGADIADLIVAVSRGLGRLAAVYRSWDERRQTIADLERLDDRCLSDIGIQRNEIASFAAGHLARHDADEHLYVMGTAPAVAANTQTGGRVAA